MATTFRFLQRSVCPEDLLRYGLKSIPKLARSLTEVSDCGSPSQHHVRLQVNDGLVGPECLGGIDGSVLYHANGPAIPSQARTIRGVGCGRRLAGRNGYRARTGKGWPTAAIGQVDRG